MSDILYVVTCISNPKEYKSRYDLYHAFKKYINKHDNVKLYTIELAIGDQEFMVTEANDEFATQVRGSQEIWHKENLMNIAIANLPEEAKYVAWVDADIQFANPNWAQDTIDALQTHNVVQMFSEYVDLGPEHQIINKTPSFVARWLEEKSQGIDPAYESKFKGATGLAWAAKRDVLINTNYLLDWCIIGSSDWYMAYTMTGAGSKLYEPWMSDGYVLALLYYRELCDKYVGGKVGCVNGAAIHYWHGPKSKRGYNWRWNILKENKFDPIRDLEYNEDGLLVLRETQSKMHEQIKHYFVTRDEDSKELV